MSETPASEASSTEESTQESSTAPETTSVSETTSVPETISVPETTSAPEPSYRLNEASAFRGGMAYVAFYDETAQKNYCGVIDTKGTLQAYFEGSAKYNDQSNNGYLSIRKDKNYYVIAPDGNVTTYETTEDSKVYEVYDSYVILQEHKAGFSEVEWIYHIYDGSGKELTSYSAGEREISSIFYAGEGIFLFRPSSRELTEEQKNEQASYGYSQEYWDVYFAQSDTWLKDQLITNGNYAFEKYSCKDGVFMFRGSSQEGSNNTHKGEFTYADAKGEVKTFTVPEEIGQRPYFISHKNGAMLFADTDNNFKSIYRYDVADDKWTSYEGEYVENMERPSYSPFPVVDGKTAAIRLKGADNKAYTMIPDENMKDVLDSPIFGYPVAMEDGVLYLGDPDNSSVIYCYDLKGKKLAEISADTSRNWFEDGIIVDNEKQFLKTDGTPAFEIDYSKGKLVTLPE